MTTSDKTIVLDRTTKNKREFVDFVFCCNCGKTMLVDLGAEKCPECDEEGCLQWENENQEVGYDTFQKDYKNEYILCDTEC